MKNIFYIGMKYLNDRERFIKDLKELREIKIEDIKINESVDMTGSGPFNNDTPWGDTLVGRLMNHIRRKMGIGINMVRIQPVIKRLKIEFDNVLEYSAVGELSEQDRKKITLIIVCQLVRYIKLAIVDKKSTNVELDKAEDDSEMIDIKDEDYLDEVDSIITDVIQQIGELSDQFGEIDSEDELVSILRELQKKVKELKGKLKKESSDKKSDDLPKAANESFKSVAEIIIEYKKMKDAKASEFKKKEVKTDTKKDTETEIPKETTETPKETPGTEIPKSTEKPKETPGTEIPKSTEKPKETPGTEEDTTKDNNSFNYINESTTSPILVTLRSMYDTFLQIEPDTLKDLDMFLKKSEEGQLTSEFSDPIVRMFKNVVGVKEDINILLSNDKKLSDAIRSFYNVSKTKLDGSFEGISEGMKSAIVKFNSNMTNLIQVVSKKENKLLKYEGFKRIFESEGDESKKDANVDTNTEEVTYKNQQDILSKYWEEVWETKMSKILLTEEKYKQLRKEVDEIASETQKSLTLNGIDPVISIVKLFNRAYKLYTVNSIPGGRSGGKISRGVSNEYTPVGGGGFSGGGEGLSGTNGPYRNNKIFNMWESAVLDIFRERKYQPIFDKNTKIRVGNKLVEGAGPIIKKFMNELLDGSKLYKGGKDGAGAQYEFIDKYFGSEAAESAGKGGLDFDGTKGQQEREETAGKVKSIQLNFEKKEFEIKDVKEFRRSIIRIECEMIKEGEEKEENKEKTTNKRYFFVIDQKDQEMYVVHSRSFGNLNQYIKNDFSKKGIEVSYKESSYNSEVKTDVYLTKMKARTFIKMLQNGSVINLVGHTPDNPSNTPIGNQKTVGKKWLCTIEGEDIKKYKLDNYSAKDAKGFDTSTLQAHAKESTISS